MKTAIVIPARSTSTRLPSKHLLPLYGEKSILEVLIERMQMVTPDVDIIVATPWEDIQYKELIEPLGVKWFGGSHHNVLERLVKATRGYDRFVLVNGDSPLMCPRLIDRMLVTHKFENLDVLESLGPSGFRAKVIKTSFLVKWLNFIALSVEHILMAPPPYDGDSFRENPTSLKFSIDSKYDLEFVRLVVKETGIEATLQQIIEVALSLSCHTDNGTGDPTGHTSINSTPTD